MNNYELTVILPGAFTPAKKKAVLTKIEKLVAAAKGKIRKTDEWGELELAYPIAKNTTGLFIHYHLELEPKETKDLDTKLNLEEEIIRYLLVRKE